MKKIPIGVVGVGYLGKFHAEKYSKMDNVELIGIADINQETAFSIANKYNTTFYADYKELIGKVKAVSIAVPTPLHFEVSRNFLLNGISVLIEKPITTTLEEADELINIAEKKGAIIQVGHLERFNPAVQALKKIVKEPMFIEAHRLSFYKERGTDVSVILDLMIHDIDIILSIVNSDIKKIDSAGAKVISQNIDIANARLEFQNGCVANVTASRISIKNERKLRIFQQNEYIAVDFTNSEITRITIDNSESANSYPIPGAKIDKQSFTNADALEAELKSFIDTILFDKPCIVDGHQGRKALKIALEVMGHLK